MAAGVDPTRAAALFASWRADWNKFIREALGVELDAEQQAVVSAVQGSPLVSVRSGTARGKDFVAACAALCFLYLTPRWNARRTIYPGQVDYQRVKDKFDNWCTPIRPDEARSEQDDFEFEGRWYLPDDLFRKKVLGQFPKVGEDSLIPHQWLELAHEQWRGAAGREPIGQGARLHLPGGAQGGRRHRPSTPITAQARPTT